MALVRGNATDAKVFFTLARHLHSAKTSVELIPPSGQG